jgi:hypothetical protein
LPWSWKGRAIPLLPLWAVRPVQSLSACTRVHFFLKHSECLLIYTHTPLNGLVTRHWLTWTHMTQSSHSNIRN